MRDLVILALLDQHGRMNVSAIANAYPNVSESTISTTISRLWKKLGLVSKTINPQNQRETFVELTNKGKAVVAEQMRLRTERYRLLLEALNVDAEEQQVLIRILERAIKFFDSKIGLDSK